MCMLPLVLTCCLPVISIRKVCERRPSLPLFLRARMLLNGAGVPQCRLAPTTDLKNLDVETGKGLLKMLPVQLERAAFAKGNVFDNIARQQVRSLFSAVPA